VITSADGSTIGYRTTGDGPGLVVVHGALETAKGYQAFADALADEFTVHVIDRRGRAESGPHRADHSLKTEVEDVSAVVRATGSQRLFGVSSGAVIALETARELPDITHVVAYEPPINASKRKGAVIARFKGEVANGRHMQAMVTVLKGLEVGPIWLRLLPRWVLVPMMTKFAEQEEVDIVELVPTALYDFRVVEEGSANLERFKAVNAKVLLMGGSKSPRYLKDALDTLAGLMPDAERAMAEGADHNSSSETPRLVIPALKAFFRPN
jgi:pimeloyl-ACP methyl ester carboxylesterase